MPVPYGTVVFEESTKHLNVPNFFGKSKARFLVGTLETALNSTCSVFLDAYLVRYPVIGHGKPLPRDGNKYSPSRRGQIVFVCFVEKRYQHETKFSRNIKF